MKLPLPADVKNSSLQTLAPLYPLLNDTKEYHLKRLNKRVRYLPPNYRNEPTPKTAIESPNSS